MIERTRGDAYEGVAFTFCKAATIILLCGSYALPIASGAAALFYGLAHLNGKRTTRCFARVPWMIGLFWGLVCALSIAWRMLH